MYSKSIIIDFVGMSHAPSRLYIICVDVFILAIQSSHLSLFHRYEVHLNSENINAITSQRLPEQVDAKGIPIIATIDPLAPARFYLGYELRPTRSLPV
jgi:hypothetical protein